MIRSITATSHLGDTIKLGLFNPEDSGYIIQSISGLGAGKADINTSKMATADGALFNSSRLDERNIVLSLMYYPISGKTVEDLRQQTYKFFPIKRKVILRIETDNRDVEIVGYVETNESLIFSDKEGVDISIICPDPFFHSRNTAETNFSGIEPAFEFPFGNESLTNNLLVMGEIKTKSENVIYYDGDSEVGFTIKIHAVGDASEITIYNVLTREQMYIDTQKIEEMTGSGIIRSDDIIINTEVGNKSIVLIRNGVTINILNCVEKNTDWFKLSKGNNIFAYTAATGETNLQFVFFNRIIYEGV